MLQRVESLWRRSSKAAGELLQAGGRGVGADVAVAALRHPAGASGLRDCAAQAGDAAARRGVGQHPVDGRRVQLLHRLCPLDAGVLRGGHDGWG